MQKKPPALPLPAGLEVQSLRPERWADVETHFGPGRMGHRRHPLSQKGWAGINLDVVNFIYLVVGVLLHWTPASFLKAALEGGSFIWGVVIQPFWAIPLPGVAKLGFRDIMGYCMVYFLIYMVVISIGFLALPYLFPH
jgi:short subunit fatty acids transporter